MNVTSQSYVPAGWVNLIPMHVIYNNLNFINDSQELNSFSKNVLRIINKSKKRFEMKKHRRRNSKKRIEGLKINKHDSSSTKRIVKQIDKIHDRSERLKNMEIKTSV